MTSLTASQRPLVPKSAGFRRWASVKAADSKELAMPTPALDQVVAAASTLLELDQLATDVGEIYRFGTPPVSIEQFITDPYYLGKVGKDLYPDNVPDLLDIFAPHNNYIEVILTGATSIGKTFMTCIALCYIIYQLGCFKEPWRWIGGSSASPIVIINMSITAQKAKDVIFTRVKNMVDTSPFFQEMMPRDHKFSDRLKWRLGETNIVFRYGTGDSLSAIGDDVFAGAGDELNFFRVVEHSKRGHGEVFDPAQRLYDTISRRMKGRFSVGGLPLGKFFLLSSAQYPDDFIERRIKEAEESGELGKTVKVIRKTTWEAKRGVYIAGRPVFSMDRTFRVEVGTTRRGSRLLDRWDKQSGVVVSLGLTDVEGEVLNVPIELWDDFERDVEGSVRDFGGRVTRAIRPFFENTDVLWQAVDTSLHHPFTREETTLEDGVELVVNRLFAKVGDSDNTWQPKHHPHSYRYVHIDLGKTVDACGVAVVHVAGNKAITRATVTTVLPVFWVDLVLRVVPPAGGEIRYARVRDLLQLLRRLGMKIASITFDTFQSTDSIQLLNEQGFRASTLSVDRDVAPYNFLRECFVDGRIRMYHYEPLMVELSRLERHKDRIDHPASGSKDVADALAGAVWMAYSESAHWSEQTEAAHMPTKISRRVVPTVQQGLEEELRAFVGGAKIIRR